MLKLLANTALVLLVLVVVVLLWARWQERTGLFFPSLDLYRSPASEGLAFEDVHFASDGHELHGWYLPGPDERVVLWMHGNAGNISDRLDQAVRMKEALGVTSFMFDYRGYGQSSGRPTEKGLYSDAEAAYTWLLREKAVDPGDIILYGHSLGSAVAVDLALGAGSGAAALVLESPFTSAARMARHLYFGLPVGLIMSVRLDNAGRIGSVRMPVLVIHGVEDATIPFAMGREVFDAAQEPKSFLPVEGGDHSDCYIVGGDAYWQAWRELTGGMRE